MTTATNCRFAVHRICRRRISQKGRPVVFCVAEGFAQAWSRWARRHRSRSPWSRGRGKPKFGRSRVARSAKGEDILEPRGQSSRRVDLRTTGSPQPQVSLERNAAPPRPPNGALGLLPLGLLPTTPTTLASDAAPLFVGYRNVAWLARTHAV